MEADVNLLGMLTAARARETGVMVVELSGVFWIAAEMVILFFMIEARRHIFRKPLPPSAVWDRESTRRAAIFAVLLGLVLGTVLGRSFACEHLSARILRGAVGLKEAALVDAQAIRAHLALWGLFVTIWVVLEGAIVFQGYGAYLGLCRRLTEETGASASKRGGTGLAALALVFGAAILAMLGCVPVFAAVAVQTSPPQGYGFWNQALRISEEWLTPYRNALLLYLRVAGVAWIAFEWVAAIILWRAFNRLRRVVQTRRAGP